MTIKEYLLRALSYGRDPYYAALMSTTAYKKEYDKIFTDHESGMWIALEKFLPRFSTAEFDKKRAEYQAKYGTSINIPGFEDIIHIGTMAKITDTQMAAHRAAQKYKTPSPLSPDQLRTLAVKRARYLKALAAPTPSWVNNISAIAQALDNVEDGLVTVGVLGRLGSYATKKLWQKTIPGVGWVMLGADILNFFNIISWATFAASGSKRKLEDLCERNPFHEVAKAKRAMKLKRTWPTFGEALEIAQTCDQLFGYGLCLGGIVGMLSDIFTRASEYATFRWKPEVYNFNILEGQTPRNVAAMNKIADDLFAKLSTDWTTLSTYAKDAFTGAGTFYLQVEALIKTPADTVDGWIKNSSLIAWQKFTQYSAQIYDIYSSALMGSMLSATGTQYLSRDDQIKTYLAASAAMTPLQQIWTETDPLASCHNVRDYKFTPPAPKDAGTIATLQEFTENWQEKLNWPFIDKREATAEEIYFEYAHRIKDQFLTFSLAHKNDYAAAIAAGEVTDFVEKILRTFSDDGTIESGRSAYVNTAINMAREHLLIPPDTAQAKVTKFNEWVESYSTKYAKAPTAQEIRTKGAQLGIQWMENFPRRTFKAAYELFPKWQALQDQLKDLFVPD